MNFFLPLPTELRFVFFPGMRFSVLSFSTFLVPSPWRTKLLSLTVSVLERDFKTFF